MSDLEFAERAHDFEVLVLEAIADLLAAPIDPNTLDECAEKIASAFLELSLEQISGLRERLGEVRRRCRPPKVRGAAK